MKKILAFVLVAVLAVSALAVCGFAAVEKAECDMTNSAAIAEAEAAKAYNVQVLEVWNEIRRPMFKLPCNLNHEQFGVVIAMLNQYEAEMEEDTLYTKEYYESWDSALEAQWGVIRSGVKAAIHEGWVKSGWFSTNVQEYDAGATGLAEDCYLTMAAELNPTKTAEFDALAILANRIVYTPYTIGGANYATGVVQLSWLTQMSDLECRTFEQIYSDVVGKGINADNTENASRVAIENKGVYADTSEADMKASLEMISDLYNDYAEEFPALAPYAANYATYVANLYSASSEPETSTPVVPETSEPEESSNPATFDVVVIALAISSVVSLAGAAIAKKSR